MTYEVEKLDGGLAKLTITVDSDAFNDAREQAFKKNKNKISIPGFRKGKVPRKMIEKMYGKEIFDDDAINIAALPAYEEARNSCDLTIISHPDYDMVDVNDDDTFTFTATVAIKPEVTLGDYSEITVTKIPVEVKDEDVDREIKRVQEQNSRMVEVTDRAVKDGDIVNINFDGYVDSESFEGGKGEDYDLTIGSHSFIDNFEEQLIGKDIGDELDVNVTFPEEYHEESLQGKPAVFKVKINSIREKELPELDDEFAEEVSEFDTMDEYRADVKKNITERLETDAKNAKEAEAVSKLVDIAEMDLADEAIQYQTEQMVQEFGYRLSMQGLDPNQYMQMTGMTPQTLTMQMKPEAEHRLKSRFALEAVAEKEGLTADDKEFDDEVADIAGNFNMDPEKYKEELTEIEKRNIRTDIIVKKAAEFITGQAKEVDPPEEDKKDSDDKEDTDK